MTKRDRQRARRQATLRGERVQHAHEKLAPEQRCPKCGSRMGRFTELGLGQKAVCQRGHTWVRTPQAVPSPTPEVAPPASMGDVCTECGGSGTDAEPRPDGEQVCKACNGTGERAPSDTAPEPISLAERAWATRTTATSA